jgi:hypothetical protein
MFWRKLDILILDLYLYGITIQTNTKQNSVEKYAGKSQIFCFWAGSSLAHVAGLDPAGLTGSLAQASDPAGKLTRACSMFKWIIIHLNSKTPNERTNVTWRECIKLTW